MACDIPWIQEEMVTGMRWLPHCGRKLPRSSRVEPIGGGPCRFCDYRRVCASEARGSTDAPDMLAAAQHLAGLVEGWAVAAAQGHAGSRQALEETLAQLGLQPHDVAPDGAARHAADWIEA